MNNLRSVARMVGLVMMFIAIMMLFPLIISLIYGDGDALPFLYSIIIAMTAGAILVFVDRKKRDITIKGAFAVVTFGWLTMAVVGAIPFYLSGAIPTFVDCFFESMSGFSTTGASILGSEIKIESLSHGILFWRSLTHWIGGMGIILLSIAILPVLGVGGMQLYRAEFPGPVKDKITPRIKNTAEILWVVYVLISLVEFILLMSGGMNAFNAACHTFGTMATGGFSTHGESIGYYQNPYIHYVIILFMFIAGVNFSLHYRLLKGNPRYYWKSIEFRLFCILIAIFTAIIFVTNLNRGVFSGFEENFRQSLFHVVAILTTTGYGAADWEAWGALAQVVMVTLMLIGGMAGSTGGGPKVVRVQIVLLQIGNELKRLVHPQGIFPNRLGGVLIDDGVIRNVLGFMLAFGLILIFSTGILAALGLDLLTSFGASIACLSNIGPGLGEVGAVDNYGHLPGAAKWILIFLMMLGRLEVFTVLVLFGRGFWKN